MHIFTASLATETNTFSPVPTDRASFEMALCAPPGRHPETPTLCSSPMLVLRRRAREDRKLTVIEGTAAWAEPGGLLNRHTYEELRDTILAELRAALPVDGSCWGCMAPWWRKAMMIAKAISWNVSGHSSVPGSSSPPSSTRTAI
jgi:microcystin degradation protein MlrC